MGDRRESQESMSRDGWERGNRWKPNNRTGRHYGMVELRVVRRG
jgi:hypothetical protein